MKIALTRLSGKVIYEHDEASNTIAKTIIAARQKGLPLNQLSLKDCSFRGLSIIGGAFEDSELENVDGCGATLANINFGGSTFTGCNFTEANFKNSRFEKCEFKHCNFTRACFEYAFFALSTMQDCEFKGCTFEFAELNECHIVDCEFKFSHWQNTHVDENTWKRIPQLNKRFIETNA